MSKETIAVALSGGIDSLSAAYLLKKAGHRVFGVHFITGYEKIPAGSQPAEWVKSKVDHLEAVLGIKVHAVDLRKPFQDLVIRYFVNSYRQGATPNPCLVCNPSIKFGILLDWARQRGAHRLATGHYARCNLDSFNKAHLLRGRDKQKDQSYFLARLSSRQLQSALFPLGDLNKSAVIEMAGSNGLVPIEKTESQDVCFIRGPKNDFLENLPDYLPRPGQVVDLEGNQLGYHKGLHRFTIGQRKGINIPASHPYYVIRIDIKNNRLVVGKKEDTFTSRCNVGDINWINAPQEKVFRAAVRIRYRHQAAPATIATEENRAMVLFDQPQSAVTPGQAAVFYRSEEVLGGGWIE